MIWQDIVIMILSIIFSASLIPQITEGFRTKKGLIHLGTSIPITLGQYILTFVFFTLNLYFSTIISFIIGTLWGVIIFQKIIYK